MRIHYGPGYRVYFVQRGIELVILLAGGDKATQSKIAKALGTIARARGMSQLAKDTGLGRESLYKALSGDGNPSFATILKVTHALGFKLHVQGEGKNV